MHNPTSLLILSWNLKAKSFPNCGWRRQPKTVRVAVTMLCVSRPFTTLHTINITKLQDVLESDITNTRHGTARAGEIGTKYKERGMSEVTTDWPLWLRQQKIWENTLNGWTSVNGKITLESMCYAWQWVSGSEMGLAAKPNNCDSNSWASCPTQIPAIRLRQVQRHMNMIHTIHYEKYTSLWAIDLYSRYRLPAETCSEYYSYIVQQHDQKQEFRCEVWRSHSAVSDNWGRLRVPCRWVSGPIRRLHLQKLHNPRKDSFFLYCLTFQDEGTTIFRNVGNHWPHDTASRHRRFFRGGIPVCCQ